MQQNKIRFYSTAPPGAADAKLVFTGLDYEDNPSTGSIFMADLKPDAPLIIIAGFNTPVSNQPTVPTLNSFGEALSFDGRHVGFRAGWGTEVMVHSM